MHYIGLMMTLFYGSSRTAIKNHGNLCGYGAKKQPKESKNGSTVINFQAPIGRLRHLKQYPQHSHSKQLHMDITCETVYIITK